MAVRTLWLVTLAAAVSACAGRSADVTPAPVAAAGIYQYAGAIPEVGEVKGVLTVTADGSVLLGRDPAICRQAPMGVTTVQVSCAGHKLRLAVDGDTLASRALLEVQVSGSTSSSQPCILREPSTPDGPGRCVMSQGLARGGVKIDRHRGMVELRRISE